MGYVTQLGFHLKNGVILLLLPYINIYVNKYNHWAKRPFSKNNLSYHLAFRKFNSHCGILNLFPIFYSFIWFIVDVHCWCWSFWSFIAQVIFTLSDEREAIKTETNYSPLRKNINYRCCSHWQKKLLIFLYCHLHMSPRGSDNSKSKLGDRR